MTITQILFGVFAGLACVSAIAVVLVDNVVRMAFWLVMALGAMAGLFLLLHADFLAASQLLIYAGGTVVILIFGVMLTATGPFASLKSSAGQTVPGLGVSGLLIAMLVSTIAAVPWTGLGKAVGRSPASLDQGVMRQGDLAAAMADSDETREAVMAVTDNWQNRVEVGRSTAPLGLALMGLRPDRDLIAGNKPSTLSPGYLLPFEIISIHLLVVLVAAGYLARAKRPRATEEVHIVTAGSSVTPKDHRIDAATSEPADG